MTAPRQTEGATQAEREAFEDWACDEFKTVHRKGNSYKERDVHAAWLGYQHHASLSTSKQAGEADVEQLREQRDALARALEVIAVDDSADPVRDAGDELVALGIWDGNALEQHRAMLAAAPQQSQEAQGDRHGE